MSVEVLEVRQHLAKYAPFESLPDALLDEVASRVDVVYFKAGSEITRRDEPIQDLHYIRSGAVDIHRRTGELYNRLGEGDIFAHFSLLRDQRVHFPATAIEDTLIYLIPLATFQHLCEVDEGFADFVELEHPRLKSTVDKQISEVSMLTTRVRRLINRQPLMLEESTSCQEAARRISVENATAVLVLSEPDESLQRMFTDDAGRQWCLAGILTDSDFRTRVLAEGLPASTPLKHVLSHELITIQSDETVHEAMLSMLRNNVQHLPVLHHRRPVGILHLSDIIRHETHSSLYLVSNILNQGSVQGLAQLTPDVRQAYVRMVEEGANSQMVGMALSTIGRSIIRRLLELGEQALGPPPVPYSFIVLGSMARNDQTIVTDQDHALVLDDTYDAAKHDAYYAALATTVSDGLAACGYAYCKGGIMATNTRWRQPLAVWKQYFSDWIDKPDPRRLLESCIFFDLDSVYGEEAFAEELQALIADKASQSPRFLAAMARNALNRTPPIGFFRNFVMERDGRENNTINAKRRGTAPMTDLIRVHALASASRAQNSFDRLNDIARSQLLPGGVTERLRYALEFISMIRIRHQIINLQNDQVPDNNIAPEYLSSSERHTLKDAFQVLSDAQNFLRFRYPTP